MRTFADLMRAFREDLARDWRRDAAQLGPGEGEAPALVGDAPRWIDAIAAACERGATDELRPGGALDGPVAIGLDRGAQLERAVRELAVLRDHIARRFAEDSRVLHAAIDASFVRVATQHARACERVAHAFDAIAANTLAADDVDDLLQRLLATLTAHVDGLAGAELFAVTSLDDQLVRRAAIGADPTGREAREAVAREIVAERSERRDEHVLGRPLIERGELVGVLLVWTRDRLALPAQGRRVLDAVAATAASSLFDERGRLAAERVAAQQKFLADASRALATSLDIRETLDEIARLAVPALADWCVVDLVEQSRAPRRVATAHQDPARVAQARAWAEKYPVRLDDEFSSIARVLRTGEPVYVRELTDDLLVSGIRDAQRLADARALGLRSLIVAPLIARGHVLGAITLALTRASGRYGEADRELALELVRRAGIAVDNARLYDASQQAVRVREQILAVVSHDLRNPLGAIDLSATYLLQLHGEDPRARKSLEIIRRSGERMERLIRELLDLARIQSGTFAIELKDEDIQHIIDEVADAHEPMARERNITLVRAYELESVSVPCDRERIVQLLSNLIGNALKYCRSGDRITIRAQGVEAGVRIDVEDTGPGIAEGDLPRIFEPYFTAKRHAKQGTGLGLYICKGIVTAHDGTIECRSVPGQGARFTITLPRSRSSSATTG